MILIVRAVIYLAFAFIPTSVACLINADRKFSYTFVPRRFANEDNGGLQRFFGTFGSRSSLEITEISFYGRLLKL